MFYIGSPDRSELADSPMPDANNSVQRIAIASRLEELDMVVDAAEAFYKSCFEEDDRVFTGVLLVSEAVSNAIEHGNDNDASKQVVIEFRHGTGRCECWVEDEGNGFNREAIADPLASENLLEDGGRGIFLIERLADEVIYKNGGSRIGIFLKI